MNIKAILLNFGIILGIGLAVWFFARPAWINEGMSIAENRVISHEDTLQTIILYDTVYADRIKLVPHVKVEKETVFNEVLNVARLSYTFDTVLTANQTIQIDSEIQKRVSKIGVSGRIRTYPNVIFENLRLYPYPVNIETISKVSVYEKPAENYGLWLEMAGYNLGTGLSLGYSNFSVKAIHSFEQNKVFDWYGVGFILRLD